MRLGRILPLAVGVLGGALSVYVLIGEIGAPAYWIGVCGFNFLWNLSMPYLLATLADFDPRGRFVVHGVSMQFVGLAVGPFAAAQILEFGGYDGVNMAAVVLFVVAAVLLLPGTLAQRSTLHEAHLKWSK